MANYGWRLGTKRQPLVDEIARGLDTLQTFQRARCGSPDKCSQPAVVLSAVYLGDYISIGFYCIDHTALIETFLKAAGSYIRGGDNNGDIQ